MKAKKKPVVVDVFEYTGDGLAAIDWEIDNSDDGSNNFLFIDPSRNRNLYIKTLEGEMHVSGGDYIIRGVNGEFYPCKPDIFEKTYELVEE